MERNMSKRQLQAEATRKKIFKSACELFFKNGFHNVTIEEIVNSAGISTGAFYHHFSSKYDILALWHENLDEQYLIYYEDVIKSDEFAGKTYLEKIESFIINTVRVCAALGTDYIGVIYSHMLTNTDFGNSMINSNRNYFRIMYELIAEGQQCGQIIGDMDKRQIEGDLTIICRGCITDWCIRRGGDIGQHSISVVRCYLRSVSTIPEMQS